MLPCSLLPPIMTMLHTARRLIPQMMQLFRLDVLMPRCSEWEYFAWAIVQGESTFETGSALARESRVCCLAPFKTLLYALLGTMSCPET